MKKSKTNTIIVLVVLVVLGLGYWMAGGVPNETAESLNLAPGESEELIGGERSVEGCLVAAGYAYSEEVGACIRAFEMTPDIMAAAKLAVDHVGKGYALTVASFNSYEEPGAYDIMLERGEERAEETVMIRGGEVVDDR